ncbi:hypothetical protein E4U21_000903 [Claviceps maximensis]|nr:hypothetical protein E4U21_000903 [Claviceps maximensis]
MAIFEASTFLWAPLLALLCYVALIVYRLYFHPLAGIPGPKLAAATSWYEFYYEVIGRGVFCWQIKRMHDMYGPIVRINPKEVHILDTDFYDEIYASAQKKRDRYADWVVFSGMPTGVFSTCPHEHHRVRRRALSVSFSKQAIYKIGSLMQSKVDLLCRRFDEFAARDAVLRLDVAFFALANDIITEYSFGEGYDCLGREDFREDFKANLMSTLETGALVRHFPWILRLMRALPRWILARVSDTFTALADWDAVVQRRVLCLAGGHRQRKPVSGESVLSQLLSSDLPPEEKSFQRLFDEGRSLMGAGSETTSWTLTLLMWYVGGENQDMLHRLRRELRDMPRHDCSGTDLLKWLEKKRYLTAVITEALRINHGTIGRSPRIAREAISYKDHIIPAGTPMSSSNYWIHMDESIFPDPTKFSPERWLEAEQAGFPLQSLATAELYLIVATIVTQFNVEFVDTSAEDIVPARDAFVPRPVSHSKGVFAKLHRI